MPVFFIATLYLLFQALFFVTCGTRPRTDTTRLIIYPAVEGAGQSTLVEVVCFGALTTMMRAGEVELFERQ